MRDYLVHAGFGVVTAADGRSGIEIARRDRPALVLLDLGLPDVDGLDVARELRRDADVPIVILTARDDELDTILGLELEETRTLTRLVEDLRTVALAEAGTLALHREPTDIDVLVADAAGGFRATAVAAGVELRIDVPDDLPIVEVDAVRIREVIGNLLANAVRHTPPGGVIPVAATIGPAGIEITVADTGEGIDQELVPQVFDRFAKGSSSRGSGLGLAIVRSLLEAHGGTIEVASATRTGTTFRVSLPIGPDDA